MKTHSSSSSIDYWASLTTPRAGHVTRTGQSATRRLTSASTAQKSVIPTVAAAAFGAPPCPRTNCDSRWRMDGDWRTAPSWSAPWTSSRPAGAPRLVARRSFSCTIRERSESALHATTTVIIYDVISTPIKGIAGPTFRYIYWIILRQRDYKKQI